MKLSICIPIHDTQKTAYYLSRLLRSVDNQTFKDYELVIQKEGNFARNHNATLQKAKGEYIQFLQMDDYLAHGMALEKIVASIEGKAWQITACIHEVEGKVGSPHTPYWTDDIFTGNNRLGSVSTLSMRRDTALQFEEPLQWLVDCDLYYRMFLKHGYPQINNDFGLVINAGTDRLTHTISSIDKLKEHEYLQQKYAK